MVKITFEGKVTRIYDETRGQRTNHYVVVSDDSGKYANILRFTLKPNATLNCGEGDMVRVSAYIDGREWANNEGKLMYFTDLKIDTVDVLASAGSATSATTAEAKLPRANDWKSLLAVGASLGEDEAAVTARCKAYQAKVNRRFTPEDYSAIAKEIVLAHAKPTPPPPVNNFTDEMPF